MGVAVIPVATVPSLKLTPVIVAAVRIGIARVPVLIVRFPLTENE
jgi:hypothetical protein